MLTYKALVPMYLLMTSLIPGSRVVIMLSMELWKMSKPIINIYQILSLVILDVFTLYLLLNMATRAKNIHTLVFSTTLWTRLLPPIHENNPPPWSLGLLGDSGTISAGMGICELASWGVSIGAVNSHFISLLKLLISTS